MFHILFIMVHGQALNGGDAKKEILKTSCRSYSLSKYSIFWALERWQKITFIICIVF